MSAIEARCGEHKLDGTIMPESAVASILRQEFLAADISNPQAEVLNQGFRAGEISESGAWNEASCRGLVPHKMWVKNKSLRVGN